MAIWITQLNKKEKRTLGACFSGWCLDAFDVQIYSFLIPALIATWSISKGQAGLLGTIALIASAIGGWATGFLADRYGRVRMLQISVLWFSVFNFMSGFTTSFDQLMIVRALQGLGFGGEWAAGAVLMAEVIRPEFRGKAGGYVQSAYALGWALAATVSSVFLAFLPPDWAWRAVFWSGLLPALIVIFIRRYLDDSEVFKESLRIRKQTGARISILTIFQPGMLRITILTSLLALGIQGSSYAIITWLPTYLKTVRHLSVGGIGAYVGVVTLGAFCGYIASAHLSDKVGRRRNFQIFAVGCWVIDFSYMMLADSNASVLILGYFLGFFSQGIYAALGPYFSELFPTHVRATGQAFAYSFGRCFGSLFVLLVGWLSDFMPLEKAIGIFSLGGYCLPLLALLLLPETKGRALTVEIPASPAD
ncbi:MFS transporter [Undibacterium sp. TJN25]|uniref:MFS transporter n=1 Tax=Undibacterium sp. TJN25 TaxID=3413056 RepID=UPI003BF05A98